VGPLRGHPAVQPWQLTMHSQTDLCRVQFLLATYVFD
jgi:hypothetical protein